MTNRKCATCTSGRYNKTHHDWECGMSLRNVIMICKYNHLLIANFYKKSTSQRCPYCKKVWGSLHNFTHSFCPYCKEKISEAKK